MPTIKMKKGEMLKFFGPMLIGVVKGRIDILNKKFGSGEKIVIHRVRGYVVRALEDSELDINMGLDAQIKQVDENEPYLERIEVVEDILNNGYRKIVVMGEIDSGKSTFTILLSNTALEKGLKPAVIDGDVGQADIGPPGFISMSYPEEQVIWMRELKPVAMKFIGDIKPQYHVAHIVYKLSELIDRALTDQREPVIIDTDGWVGDEYAISYKHRLIDNIIPDAIVVIGNELYSIFSKYENIGIKVYGLKTPSVRRIRNREERRMLRRDKYREYLENAKQVKVSLDKVVVTGHPIFHGRPIESFEGIDQSILGKIVYASRTFDTLYIVANSPIKNEEIEYLKKTLNVSKIRIYPQNFEKNLYVAVSNGVEDYPGLIERVDFINREMVLKTFFNGDIKFVRVSSIRLLEDYSEQMI